jgi:hypothetical protein
MEFFGGKLFLDKLLQATKEKIREIDKRREFY